MSFTLSENSRPLTQNYVSKQALLKNLLFRIMEAPVGVTTSHDEGKKNEMLGTINTVMPDKKMAEVLKGEHFNWRNKKDKKITI